MPRAAYVSSLLAAACAIGGCYHYAPVDAAAVTPGTGVRARVNATTAERIAPLLGTGTTRVFTGTVVERNGGAFIVELPTVAQAGVSGSMQTLYQRVTLAPADIVELEQRTLDKPRTALLVGGAAAIAITAAVSALHDSPGIDRPPSGSTSETRIPILRLRF